MAELLADCNSEFDVGNRRVSVAGSLEGQAFLGVLYRAKMGEAWLVWSFHHSQML
ncbi:hypothetical protein [Chelativorans sp. Marseille-P2723]|uniref:hypothetical protein n=1 Tax=Chelativorans sp. Marseille-P2723 TaxID=2709133 RepID=UPI00156E1863|nr:hypothetical protein [Chelativorans sp. Marseille-P2723]